MSRIFLSHSSRDNVLATNLQDWLASNGWDDVFLDLNLTAGLAPGEKWQNALRMAADRCEAVLFLITSNWLASPWCLSEFLLAKQLGKRLFPILAGGATINGLPTEISSDHQAVDLDRDPLAWERLKEGLRRAGLDANSFSFEQGRRLYPGFASLTEKDAAIFFGRASQVTRGLDRIRLMRDAGAERMMVVLGASGAGKSSFLRAGLWPRLKRDDRNFWPLPIVRPERAPLYGKSGLFASLEQALLDKRLTPSPELTKLPKSRAALGEKATQESHFAPIIAALRRGSHVLVGENQSPPTVVLMIDQGEELFDIEARDEAQRFFDLIKATLERAAGLIVVLAIRSDAFPRFQAEPKLEAVARTTFDLSSMPAGALRLVVEGPAAIRSPPLELEPALVDVLLEDATGQDALPLLAFSLNRLMREYGAEDRLSLADYHASGGIRGAIVAAVEEALVAGRAVNAVPADAAALDLLMKQAFIPHLARVNEAGEFVRRIAYTEEIPGAARPLVDLLVEARLLTRGRDSIGEVNEVAHEALLREWPKLRGLLEADREFLIGKRQLADDIRIWHDTPSSGKSDAFLTGLRLARAHHWLLERAPDDLNAEERAYIGESVKLAGRKRKRRAALFAAVITLLAAFSVYASYQTFVAHREAEAASTNARLAAEQTARAVISETDARENAARALAARNLAERNEKQAQINEARALTSQAKAQIQESISLANQSLRESAAGDALAALRTAGKALPPDPQRPSRPYVPRAEYALAAAQLKNRLLFNLKPSADWVNKTAFTSDGKTIIVGTRDGIIKYFDAETGRESRAINTGRGAILDLVLSPDGKLLFTSHQSPSSLIAWSVERGQQIRERRLDSIRYQLTASPDNTTVIAYSFGSPSVEVFNAEDGVLRSLDLRLGSAQTSYATIDSTSFNADGSLLLLAADGLASIWAMKTASLVSRLWTDEEHETTIPSKNDVAPIEQHDSISNAIFIPISGDVALTGRRTIYVVDPNTGATKRSWRFAPEYQTRASKLAVSDSGNTLVFPIDEKTFGWFSLSEGQFTAKRSVPSKISDLALSSDGKLVATATEDRIARLWHTDAEDVTILPGSTERLQNIVFSPTGAIALTYGDSILRAWDVRPSAKRFEVTPGLHVSAVAPSMSAFLSVRSPIFPAAPTNAQPACELRHLSDLSRRTSSMLDTLCKAGIDGSLFSPSGKWLAAWTDLYRTQDPQLFERQLHVLRGLEGSDKSVDIPLSEYSKRLVIVFDVDSGKSVHALHLSPAPSGLPLPVFLSENGVSMGTVTEVYGEDGVESKTSAAVYDLVSGSTSLDIVQEGHEARFITADDDHVVALATNLKLRSGHAVTTLWSVPGRRQVARYERPLQAYDQAELSSLIHRHLLLLGSDETKPSLISFRDGSEIGQIAGKPTGASRLTTSADGERLLVEWPGSDVELWNLRSGDLISDLSRSVDGAMAVAFSGDGQRISTFIKGREHAQVTIHDSKTGNEIRSWVKPRLSQEVYAGETGRRIATQTTSREIDIDSAEEQAAPVHIVLRNQLGRWRFTAKDERLVTTDTKGVLQVWDSRTGEQMFVVDGVNAIEPLGGAPQSGLMLPFFFEDGSVGILDTIKSEIVWRSPKEKAFTFAQLAPDSLSIIVGNQTVMEAYQLTDSGLIFSLPTDADTKLFHQFNTRGDRVVVYTRGTRQRASVYDTRNRRVVATVDDVDMEVMHDGEGRIAIASGRDISFYDAESGIKLRGVSLESTPRHMEFSVAGDELIITTDGARIYTISVADGPARLVTTLSALPQWLRCTADRDKLLVYETTGWVTLRDLRSGKSISPLSGRWGNNNTFRGWLVRLDRDASMIAVRTPDNFMRAYATDTGALTVDANWGSQHYADIMPINDGREVVSVGSDGFISVWDVKSKSSVSMIHMSRKYTGYPGHYLSPTSDPSQYLAVDDDGKVDLISTVFGTYQTYDDGIPEKRVTAALSPNRDLLAVMGDNGVLRLWHVGAHEILAEIPNLETGYGPTLLRFSDDGRFLLARNKGEHSIQLLRMPLVGHELTASADRLLATALPPLEEVVARPKNIRLGVSMSEVTAAFAASFRLPVARGAMVIAVASGSAAEAAGLQVGDVIVRVNETDVTKVSDVASAIAKASSIWVIAAIRHGARISLRAIPDD